MLNTFLHLPDIIFVTKIVLRVKTLKQTHTNLFIIFCPTILFLAPLYITVYTWRGPIAIAIVEVMPLSPSTI